MSDLGGATRVRRATPAPLGHRAHGVPDQPVPARAATRVLVLDVDERAAGAVREVLAGEPEPRWCGTSDRRRCRTRTSW
ncbi:hypothetical protein GCM10025868_26620 [Angustibacter aerolatus]|uniref:Response regulatory domain-containing protein n=1 Tax=Angustibacter aerolatus TaxID=1162965 RepID=A0ABQ6JI38_9ACTN|nr:hypothetical protein [Angustibacter aerolatus]GMA87412.1 hypothetical protein GCM10025868_26620 [Angustibacter aerolatus]